MPKSKKRKTTHPPSHGETLSHEEIWDDSALQRSWHAALEEYEFYHSIAARGEDVDEVVRRAEAGGNDEVQEREAVFDEKLELAKGQAEGMMGIDRMLGDEIVRNVRGDRDDSEIEEGEASEEGEVAHDDGDGESVVKRPPVVEIAKTTMNGLGAAGVKMNGTGTLVDGGASDDAAEDGGTTEAPQTTATTTGMADQTLENVKMAYYWAGYYSGLYDAQK